MGVLGSATRAAICSIVIALAACGGGGGAAETTRTETLYVLFTYPGVQSDLRAPIRSAPEITGMQGHAPICALVGGLLPAGVTLDASSCVVSGTPTAAGVFTFIVRLTSAGVEGSVDAQGSLTVVDPTPTLVKAAGLTPSGPSYADLTLQYAHALPGRSLVALGSTYTARPGDALSYAIVGGALPSGIAFNATTGMIEGTPTGYGTFAVQIAATLMRAGASYTTLPVAVALAVSTYALQVSYLGDCLVPVATPLVCTPVVGNPSELVGVVLHFSAPGLPPGFSIDPSNGVISGSTSTVADMPVSVAIRGVYPDGSVQDAVASAVLRTAGIRPGYGPTGSNFGLMVGPITSPLPSFAFGAQLTPGVSFGIDVTGVTGPVSGDVYTYALEPLDSSTPVPVWLGIDPNTGHLFGVPPSGTVPASWRVQLTTQRAGTSYVSSASWIVWFL